MLRLRRRHDTPPFADAIDAITLMILMNITPRCLRHHFLRFAAAATMSCQQHTLRRLFCRCRELPPPMPAFRWLHDAIRVEPPPRRDDYAAPCRLPRCRRYDAAATRRHADMPRRLFRHAMMPRASRVADANSMLRCAPCYARGACHYLLIILPEHTATVCRLRRRELLLRRHLVMPPI